MAAVSTPLSQTAALNLSTKPVDLQICPDVVAQRGHVVKPIQRVQPNDCYAREDGVDVGSVVRMSELIVSRKQREFIPEESKDVRYWDRRRKNNDAAKRSRQKRRFTDIVLEAHMVKLARENESLKAELMHIKERMDDNSVVTGSPDDSMTRGVRAAMARGTGFINQDASLDFHPNSATINGFPPLATPSLYPATSLCSSYPPSMPQTQIPKPDNHDLQMTNLSRRVWPALPQHLSSQTEALSGNPADGAMGQMMPWRLDQIQNNLQSTLNVLKRTDEVHQNAIPLLPEDVLHPDTVLRPKKDCSVPSVVNNPESPVATPVQNGTQTVQEKPPSPHSAFTSGLELSKLPHKLREKMKRSLPQCDEFVGDKSAASNGPAAKVRKGSSSEHCDQPAQTAAHPDNHKTCDDDLRSVCFDNSLTPPPSSSSSSDGNTSPCRVGPLFDFSMRGEHFPKITSDLTLSETHERMVRAAHALSALNKGVSDKSIAGIPFTDGQMPLMDEREKYWDKRRRNNQAAKKCRDAKRLLIDYRAARSAYLEQENSQLRRETSVLQQEVASLKELVKKRTENETYRKTLAI